MLALSVCLANLLWILQSGPAPAHAGSDSRQMSRSVTLSVSIQVGQTVTLTWNAEGSSKVFASWSGIVSPSGSTEVRPERTTTYTLLAEGEHGLISKTMTVEVRGGRGDDELWPDPHLFDRFYISDKLAGISFIDFANRIRQVLQDDLMCTVRTVEYDDKARRLVLLTEFHQDYALVLPSETNIRQRRIAYRVEAVQNDPAEHTIGYTVGSLIQRQLMRDAHWRIEPSEEVYRKANDRVREGLTGSRR
jgi:hypothetical protein